MFIKINKQTYFKKWLLSQQKINAKSPIAAKQNLWSNIGSIIQILK